MDELRVNLSLVALTACLAHGGWLAVWLLRGRRQVAFSSLFTTLLGCLLLFAAGASWGASESFPLPRLSQLVVFLAVAAWVTVRFGQKSVSRDEWKMSRSRSILAVHALLLVAAAWNFHETTRDEPDDLGIEVGQDQVLSKVPVVDAVVVTDHGRIFSVFRYDTNGHTYGERPLEMFQDRVVPVASPDLNTNCHGWVFANGRYAIPETAVTALLQDNGYIEVTSPQADDVIVYRDDAGKILHSGRVRRVHEDGQVWIESKWGPGARYMHLPQDQCYSRSFAYYRSTRPSHEAQIVQTPVTNDGRMARSDNLPLRRARG